MFVLKYRTVRRRGKASGRKQFSPPWEKGALHVKPLGKKGKKKNQFQEVCTCNDVKKPHFIS